MGLSLVSLSFFAFFGVVFCLYWLIKRNAAQKCLILGASYLFYALFDYRFCFILLGVSVLAYGFGVWIDASKGARRKLVLATGLTLDLLVLGVFKYFNFFADGASRLLSLLQLGRPTVTLHLLLPIGLSFYLFKAASYLIDVYRRDSPGCREPLDLLVYIGFFPQLLSGPIDRATTFLPQLRQARAFDYSLAVDGTRQILWGLFKKLALADGLATLTGQISASYATAQGPDLGLGAVLFSLQIYCDLSGYTDMATGLAKLLGIRTMRNFAYPYFSQNVAEFWRRWNISVSSWFRDYVYIPLGGSRVSRFRLIINILLTFVLSGLWHGANVTFLAWGAMLGVAVLFTSLRRKHVLKATDTPGGDRRSLASLAKILVTFSYISLSWIFFQSASMGQALGIFRRLFTPTIDPGAWLVPLRRLESMGVLAGVLLVFIIIEWLQRRRECPLDLGRWPRWVRWLAYTFTFWTMASLYNPGLSGDFLYYRF